MPFLTGFGKRKEIRYGTVFPDANLSDFPKRFKISADSDIAAELASGGGIAVTEADGETTVPFGLYPSSDPTSGDLILRAKFDVLTAASTGDVLGYLYYDAGETTTEDKAGVVSNGYAGFFTLDEDPSGSAPQIFDWVSESNVGTSSGSMTSGDLVAGQVGNGLDFDGSDDSINLGPNASNGLITTPSLTVEGLAKLSADHSGSIVGCWDTVSAVNQRTLHLSYQSSRFEFAISRNGTEIDDANGVKATTVPSVGTTYAVAGRYNSSTSETAIFVDGVKETSHTLVPSLNNPTTTQIGIGAIPGRFGDPAILFWQGVLDEIRISGTARSDGWLAYAHADDFTNSDTFSLGAEEVDGGTDPQTITLTPVAATWSITAPAVNSAATIAPAPLTAAWSPVAPSIVAAATISLDPLAASWSIVAPAIVASGSPNTISLTPIAAAWSITPPAVLCAATIAPAPLSAAWTVAPPTVQAAATISLTPLVATWEVVGPGIVCAATIELTPVAAEWAVAAPTIFASGDAFGSIFGGGIFGSQIIVGA